MGEAGEVSSASGGGAPPEGGRRNRVLILGAVAVVVAMVAGVTVWFTRQAPPEADDASGGPPRSVPVRFDPGQQLIRLDFLPGPVREATYVTEPDMHTVTVRGLPDGAPATEEGDRAAADQGWWVEVMMAARDVDVHRYDREYDEEHGWRVPGDAVAPVRGRPAFQNEGRVLSWEYARNAWMRLTLNGVDRHDEILRRVVEGIRWEAAPLALPFTAGGLPDGAVLGGARLEWAEDGPLRASSQYLLRSNQDHNRPDIVVGLTTEDLASGRSNLTEDVTVSGRSATATDWRSKSRPGLYRVAQLPGCAACVVEFGVLTRQAHEAVGGRDVLKLAASIRLVDGHDDPARWRPR
ncbi:hypothetical protein [Micromonospora sp. SH-82]|uniref:hypothetical protein n=1 Tax=Micromonospora sp. SH-82 TaxID=3132938 RepID=UPI003EBD2BAD